MRLLQNILFVVGAASLGTAVSFGIVVFLISLLQSPGGEPWTRGFGQLIGGMILAPAGGVVGILAAVGWIRIRGSHRTWPIPVWLGIVLGCGLGYWGMESWAQHGGFDSWITTLLAMAAGGLIGGFVASAGNSVRKSLSSKRTSQPGRSDRTDR